MASLEIDSMRRVGYVHVKYMKFERYMSKNQEDEMESKRMWLI